jgi:hypothetical protein
MLRKAVSHKRNSNNNDCGAEPVLPTPRDFVSAAKDIQNRRHRFSSEDVEKRIFREFFGASAEVVSNVWRLLTQHDLLPEKGQIVHLLWALFFLKVYPKQGPACSVVGGSAGAVDAKTFRKWVWEFIVGISELEEHVVSN